MERMPHSLETRLLTTGAAILALGAFAVAPETHVPVELPKIVYIHEDTARVHNQHEARKRKVLPPKKHGFQPKYHR